MVCLGVDFSQMVCILSQEISKQFNIMQFPKALAEIESNACLAMVLNSWVNHITR